MAEGQNGKNETINTGARSIIINKLEKADVDKTLEIANKYYNDIRKSDNKKFVDKLSQNSKMERNDVEAVVNHVFKEKHRFADGRYERFGVDKDIVKAFERIKTNEHTDTDILLLKHELLELTYMKNKKYNIYETAHKLANKKYNWWEKAKNENVQKKK